MIMYHGVGVGPSTKVRILTKDNYAETISVSKLYERFFYLADMYGNIKLIEHPDVMLKIGELNQWTDVIGFNKAKNQEEQFTVAISDAGGAELTSVTCGEKMVFPVYNPDVITKGYHGETKYQITDTLVGDLKVGDTVRYKDNEAGFAKVTSITSIDRKSEVNMFVLYGIITKSESVEMNGIHLRSALCF